LARERLAVLGATGYTGRLVCGSARSLGLPLRLVGRRREALEAVAGPDDEVRVADARDVEALADAFDGVGAVVSLAGPFLAVGFAAVEAAIRAGAHYVDSSGEQAFAREIYERFDARASERGVALLTSFGFDYVPGDLAARIAAEGLEPVDKLAVAYAVSSIAASRGTRRTIGHVLGQGQVAYVERRLVPSRIGATTRSFVFPWGERPAVEWGGTEPLTVPRHTDVATVRSYVRAPRVAGAFGRVAGAAAPLVRVAGAIGRAGPSQRARDRTRFAVVAEARGALGARRATVTGTDVYGLTGLLLARAAEALLRGEVRKPGALAPAQAFDARGFAERLEPLLRVAPTEDL
jgi:short subunit dehydrogenase-like uncharacterized protein